MKPTAQTASPEPPTSRRRPLVLVAVFFLLGGVLAGTWVHYLHAGAGENHGGLSEPTKKLLSHLETPVSIRYYALLPAGSADETLRAFAERVGRLLAAIQNATGGQVKVTRFDTPADTNAASATADGIHPFNLEKGDACFLGLDVASREHSESFAQLQPEWEAALEYDLARAILRVGAPAAAAKPNPAVATPSPEIISSIHRLIPDVNATSAVDADRIFHDDFMQQCASTGAEVETRITAAQEQVARAQASGSESALEAARKNLAQVQVAQGDKLKQLATRLQTQLAVFQQMKAATNSAK